MGDGQWAQLLPERCTGTHWKGQAGSLIRERFIMQSWWELQTNSHNWNSKTITPAEGQAGWFKRSFSSQISVSELIKCYYQAMQATEQKAWALLQGSHSPRSTSCAGLDLFSWKSGTKSSQQCPWLFEREDACWELVLTPSQRTDSSCRDRALQSQHRPLCAGRGNSLNLYGLNVLRHQLLTNLSTYEF